MPKKSKPKQRTNWKNLNQNPRSILLYKQPLTRKKPRTNWKQRALHCEEVIGVQNELARVTGEELRQYKIAYKREYDLAANAETRAVAAEKHIGELRSELYCQRISARILTETKPAPTHWQRFKSWLGEIKADLFWLMLILGVLAGLAAFVRHGR